MLITGLINSLSGMVLTFSYFYYSSSEELEICSKFKLSKQKHMAWYVHFELFRFNFYSPGHLLRYNFQAFILILFFNVVDISKFRKCSIWYEVRQLACEVKTL
jgi:hypothetical protein